MCRPAVVTRSWKIGSFMQAIESILLQADEDRRHRSPACSSIHSASAGRSNRRQPLVRPPAAGWAASSATATTCYGCVAEQLRRGTARSRVGADRRLRSGRRADGRGCTGRRKKGAFYDYGARQPLMHWYRPADGRAGRRACGTIPRGSKGCMAMPTTTPAAPAIGEMCDLNGGVARAGCTGCAGMLRHERRAPPHWPVAVVSLRAADACALTARASIEAEQCGIYTDVRICLPSCRVADGTKIVTI